MLVTIRDQTGALVSGATATGFWAPAGTSDPDCTTEATGQCTISQVDMQRWGESTVHEATFTLTAISHPELTYEPADDQVPLTVAISKP